MKHVFLFASVVTLLSSCVSLPQATEEDLSRTYSKDMRVVFHAARNVLEELGCEITEGNLKSGSVIGRRREWLDWRESSDWCMFYRVDFKAGPSEESTVVNVDIYLRKCITIVALLSARAYKADFVEFWQALEANFE